MDVICLSSDSEDVSNGDNPETFSRPFNFEDDVFVCGWEDDYPAVDYNSQPDEEDVIDVELPMENGKRISSPEENSKVPCITRNSDEKLATSVYDISEVISSEDEGGNNLISMCTKKHKELNINRGRSAGPKTLQNELSQEPRHTIQAASKEKKKLEKERQKEEKKAELQRQKAVKLVFAENQRNLKPEENIKFLKVHIDTEIINSPCGASVISVLQQNSIQYAVESQIKSHTITWSKTKTIKEIDDFGIVRDVIDSGEEKELVYIMDWETTVRLIHDNDLLTHVETVKSVHSDKNLTLIIYGMEKYLNYCRNKKKNPSKSKGGKLVNEEKAFIQAPTITKDQLEFALTDLQLWGRHNCRLFETPEELSSFIFNITKSLSQLELKMDKQKRQGDDFDWFAKGDSNTTVKIDKNGVGLINLWQQQICQFNSVGLETAQAIVSQFGSPSALLTKYKECDRNDGSEGELLLQNIQIRRELGLLSSTRRIGPQLSKKIYKFFTCDDPDVEL